MGQQSRHDAPIFGRHALGLVDGQNVQIERFQNRFDVPIGADETLIDVHLRGATDAQIGSLGEETAAAFIESELGGTIVALGDTAMPRTDSRQDLDVIAIVDGELIAYEVKTRYRSRDAGRLTRQGNLRRPRLRRPNGPRPRQGSQDYVADRISSVVDTGDGYEGIDVRLIAVDLVAMLLQEFSVNDSGTRTTPLGPPHDCARAAEEALNRILAHRDWL